MTKVTRLTNADYVRQPWKNGGGTTTATSRSTAATSRSPPGDTLRVDDAAASTISALALDANAVLAHVAIEPRS